MIFTDLQQENTSKFFQFLEKFLVNKALNPGREHILFV